MHIFHKWKTVKVKSGYGYDYNVISGSNYNIPMTQILYKCNQCEKFKTEQIKGHWDENFLNHH